MVRYVHVHTCGQLLIRGQYVIPVVRVSLARQATWSEAYFDEGGANRPIITYSVPIRQDGIFVGVATMDVALDPSSTLGMSQPVAYEELPNGQGETR